MCINSLPPKGTDVLGAQGGPIQDPTQTGPKGGPTQTPPLPPTSSNTLPPAGGPSPTPTPSSGSGSVLGANGGASELTKTLQDLVGKLSQLVSQLNTSPANGGPKTDVLGANGGPTQSPAQGCAPGGPVQTTPPAPVAPPAPPAPPTGVNGANGGPAQTPAQTPPTGVGGESGPPKPPTPAPAPAPAPAPTPPATPAPPTGVNGANGGPAQTPTQTGSGGGASGVITDRAARVKKLKAVAKGGLSGAERTELKTKYGLNDTQLNKLAKALKSRSNGGTKLTNAEINAILDNTTAPKEDKAAKSKQLKKILSDGKISAKERTQLAELFDAGQRAKITKARGGRSQGGEKVTGAELKAIINDTPLPRANKARAGGEFRGNIRNKARAGGEEF